MTRLIPSRTMLALGLAGVVLVGGTGALLLTSGSPTASPMAGPTPTPAPAPPATAALAGLKGDEVPWERPLTVTASEGSLTAVTAIASNGAPVTGTLTPTSWMSASTLVPGVTYTLHVALLNADGVVTNYEKTVRAADAKSELQARISPAGGTYGVGQPVIVRLNHPVKGADARRAVLERLRVTTTPAVEGAWRWYNSSEVHYRGPAYWKPGTQVTVRADLTGLHVPGTLMWGADKVVKGGMTIGSELIATVDVTAHTMTVRRDGKVVRVIKVSTGRKEFPTKGGPHIVLKREKVHTFNSATIGIPTASPDGYYEDMPWSVRISNGGAFVHTNAATIRYQGVVNVSHGCVNASPTDAKWFYENSQLGDVVDVIHAAVGPNRSDAGMFDWGYSWDLWKQGNLGT